MTFDAIKAEISRQLAEVDGRTFWTDAEIATAANEGYMELSDATEWFETFLEVPLLNDRPYYDLRTVVGETFLAIGPAFDMQTNRWLLPTTVRQFDAHDRRWERVTGEPQRLLMRGLWWLGYWPRIQSDLGLVKQYYSALPDPLVDDSDEPGFPDTFHYGIIDFALTELWAQDGEVTRAMASWKNYLAQERDLALWVAERGGPATLHGFGAIGSVAR